MTENVGWAGGMAVYEGRLYWSDVMLMTVESAKYDGSERATLFHRLREQPAGLAVLSGFVYFGYRGATGELHRIPLPKNGPVNVTEDTVIRPGLPDLLDVKAIDVSSGARFVKTASLPDETTATKHFWGEAWPGAPADRRVGQPARHASGAGGLPRALQALCALPAPPALPEHHSDCD